MAGISQKLTITFFAEVSRNVWPRNVWQRAVVSRRANVSRTVLGVASVLSLVLSVGFTFGDEPAVKAAVRKDAKRVTLPKQVEKIDLSMSANWSEFGIKPSPVEDDLKWCRRVFLDVIGRIPSFEEFSEFAKDKAPDKRFSLVNRLINEDRYTEEYANNWSTVWTNVLIGRNGGMENRSLTNREGMQKYLRDCFARNKPYNEMVLELVTASGATKPGVEGFNGAKSFGSSTRSFDRLVL